MHCQQQIQLMGTTIDISINAANASALMHKVIELLHQYNARFSANDNSSQLMAINKQAGIAPTVVHPELFELIETGKYHSLLPFGNFDMTIGPVVKLWKIGFNDANIPSQKNINTALSLVNANDVILNRTNYSVHLAKKGMEIDLGALAKGYIADKIIHFLKENNVNSASINLGGNVMVYGDNPNRENGMWYIGVQQPNQKRHHHLGIIPVKNQSVVTSGVYERFLTVNGKTYHHIFNKKTGYPIETNMASLTIIAQTSLMCEICTSQLFGLPISQVMTIINALDDIEGIIVTNDNDVILSNQLHSSFIKL